MRHRRPTGRRLLNTLAVAGAVGAGVVGTGALGWILWVVVHHGAQALGWEFFTRLPVPPGMKGGGMANAILGTLVITALAAVMALPPGILAGVWLAEFAGRGRLANLVRFAVNTLMGIPSIILGLFVWGAVVVTTGGFSGWAGAMSLMLIMLPVVARVTEDMLAMVPRSLHEAVLATGAPMWRAVFMALRAARGGIITGAIMAIARASGETAPLLFTALNSPYWPADLSAPTANLPVSIFNYAMSPYHDWQTQAWGASLVITAVVLSLAVVARGVLGRKKEE